MIDTLTRALDRSRGVAAAAHDRALREKAAGLAGVIFQPQSAAGGMFGDWAQQGKGKRQYAQFRGWLYSAVHALAMEAAGQPVNLSRLKGSTSEEEPEKGKRKPGGTKSHLLNRMTESFRRKAAAKEWEVVEEDPLLDGLERPNPFQSRWQFVYSFVCNLNLTGIGYIVSGEGEEGAREFYSLPTTWVRPDHTKEPFGEFRVVDPKNPAAAFGGEAIPRECVAWASFPNPSDPLGCIAPATSQDRAIQVDDHIQTSQERFFENSPFPGAIVTIGKDPHPDVPGGIRPRLTGAQRRQVIGAIRKVMCGVANYGAPAVVDGLIESITKLSMNQNEIGWDKSEDKVRTRILSAFSVHPYILGEPVGVGGYAQVANIEKRFFARVNTFLDMLGLVVTGLVAGGDEGQKDLWVWWEKLEARDPSLYWQNLQSARSRGDISQNELRAALNMPPDEDDRQAELDAGKIAGVVQVMTLVGGGAMQPAQAQAIMEGMGIGEEMAARIAGGQTQGQQLGQAVGALEQAVASLRRPIEVRSVPVLEHVGVENADTDQD